MSDHDPSQRDVEPPKPDQPDAEQHRPVPPTPPASRFDGQPIATEPKVNRSRQIGRAVFAVLGIIVFGLIAGALWNDFTRSSTAAQTDGTDGDAVLDPFEEPVEPQEPLPAPCDAEPPAPFDTVEPVETSITVANFLVIEGCIWEVDTGESLTVELWPFALDDSGIWFEFDEVVDAEVRRDIPGVRRLVVSPHLFPSTVGPPSPGDGVTVIALFDRFEGRVVASGVTNLEEIVDLTVEWGS